MFGWFKRTPDPWKLANQKIRDSGFRRAGFGGKLIFWRDQYIANVHFNGDLYFAMGIPPDMKASVKECTADFCNLLKREYEYERTKDQQAKQQAIREFRDG